jgi:hypothetical protein
MAIHPKSDIVPEHIYKDIKKMSEREGKTIWIHLISMNGLSEYSRREQMTITQGYFMNEEFGIPFETPITHVYIFHVAPDGSYVYYKRPTKNAWTDSVWYSSKGIHSAITGELLRIPSYHDIVYIAIAMWRQNPEEYEKVAQMFKKIQDGKGFPTWEEMDAINIKTDLPIYNLMMCVNAAFVEQDIKNHAARGRRMFYSNLPQTIEEMKNTFDLVNGIFLAREDLRYMHGPLMDFITTYNNLDDNSAHLARFAIRSKTDPEIIFFKGKKKKDDAQPRELIIDYGRNNNLLIMDKIVLNKTGLHVRIREENLNQEYLENWFNYYFSEDGIKINATKFEFAWGDATIEDGFVDVRIKQNWTAEDIYKKVKSLKKNVVDK